MWPWSPRLLLGPAPSRLRRRPKRTRLALEELESRLTPSTYNVLLSEKFETNAVAGQSTTFNALANFQGVTDPTGFTARIHWGDQSTDSPDDGQPVTITPDPRDPQFLFDINGTHTYPVGISFTYHAWVQLTSPDSSQTWGGPAGPFTYVAASAPPPRGSVQVNDVHTDDSRNLTVQYEVSGNDTNTPFTISVYRSDSATFVRNSVNQVQVANVTLQAADASSGPHTIKIGPDGTYSFSVTQPALAPDTTGGPVLHNYVIATSDDSGSLNSADYNTTPQQDFHIVLLGVLAHGYARELGRGTPSASNAPRLYRLFQGYATDLRNNGYDPSSFAFFWPSTTATTPSGTNQAVASGTDLAAQVETVAKNLNLGPHDVVDVNFIGYSRGAVVVSHALLGINSDPDGTGVPCPQLQAGFMMETLIDPHPASNTVNLPGFSATALGNTVAVPRYRAFQRRANDPNAFVPANVQAAVDYYQQSGNDGLPFNGEGTLNLWGELPGLIPNSSKTTLLDHPMTGQTYAGNPIGHGQIIQAYDGLVIQTKQTLDLLGLQPFRGSSGSPLKVTAEPPDTVIAGTPFGLVVTDENADGSVNTSFDGPVTVALNDSYGYGNTLGGTQTVTAVNGVATFSGLTVDQAAPYSLTITSAAAPAAYTSNFNVTAAPASQLVLQSPPGNVLDKTPFGVEVLARDRYNNVDPAFNGSVTLALGNNSGGISLGGTLTATAVHGVASFSGLAIDHSGSYAIQAAANSLTAANTLPVEVSSDQLVVTTQPPADVTSGTAFGLVVSVEDSSGNVDSLFQGSVEATLVNSSGDAGNLPGTSKVTAVNGMATFSGLTVDAAGSWVLAVRRSGLAGATTDLFQVDAAPATQLVVTTEPPGTVTAGAAFEVDLAAEDSSGNADPNFTGSVTLALDSSDDTPSGTVTATAFNGVATFSSLTINNVGSGYTWQASSSGLTSATTNAMDATSSGRATRLVVTTQPPSTVTAGIGFGLVVTAEDSFGNMDTGFNGSVTVNDPNGGSPLGQALAVHGVATVSGLTLDQAGVSYSLAVTGTGLAPATTNLFDVKAAAATHLVVLDPSRVLPRVPFAVEVQAVDPYGNVDSTFNGGVTLALNNSPSSAALGGSLTGMAVNGLASFSGLTIDNPGIGYTLKAAGTGLVAQPSPAFDVTSDQLVVTAQPPDSVTAGHGFGLVVSVEDSSGKADPSFQGSLTVGLVNFGTTTPTLSGTLTVPAVNGVATFSGLTLTQPGDDYALVVTGKGMGGAVTDALDVTAVAAPHLVVTTPPPNSVAAGSSFGLTLAAEDSQGNVDATFNGSVTLALVGNPAGGTLSGTRTALAANGVVSFNGLTLNRVGSGYLLRATASGVTAATTTAVSVTAGTATHLVVTTPPPDRVISGSGFSLAFAAEDAEGNVDATFNGSVTLALAGSPSGATLDGPLSVTAHNGVAVFVGVSLSLPGSGYTLRATAAGLVAATTDPFLVVPPPSPPPLIGDVTGDVTVTLTPAPRSRKNKAVNETLTIRDNAGQSLQGPLYVVLRGLRSTVKVKGAAGFVGTGKKKSPFVVIDPAEGTLPSQGSVSRTLSFTGKPNQVTLLVFADSPPR
jgi:hypothetical protein